MAGFQTLVNGQTFANSHEHTKSTSSVAHLNKEGLKRSFSSHTRHPAKDYRARKQATQDQSAASHKKQRLPRRPRTVASEPNMSLAEHIRHNARQIVGSLLASLPYCLCVFKISLVLTAAVLILWGFPTVWLHIVGHFVAGIAGHILFTLIPCYGSDIEDNKGREVRLLRLPGLDIYARNIEEPAKEQATHYHMCVLLFVFGQVADMCYWGYNVLSSKTKGESSTVGGTTPVMAYIKQASTDMPVIEEAPHNARDIASAQRYNISSSGTTYIGAFTEHRDPQTQPITEALHITKAGVLISTIGILNGKASSSLVARIAILPLPILALGLQTLDSLTASLHALLSDPSPDFLDTTSSYIAYGTLTNGPALQKLVAGVAGMMYNARDAPLQQAWWHETDLPTTLGSTNIVELTDWVKLCLAALQAKREKLARKLAEREKTMMHVRLPGKVGKLPRNRAVREREAAKLKVKIGAKEMMAVQMESLVERVAENISGVAGDLAGVGGKKE
jgi:hypothetical protein